jgi:hypothetical protein
MYFSNKYGLGHLHNPGPGLMPFLLGFLFFIISFYLLMVSLFKKREGDEIMKKEKDRINYGKMIFVSASLFFYGLFLETLGFLIVTLITLTILFWTNGLKRWRSLGVASCLTVLVTYFLFTYLGVRFPAGILRVIGLY